VQVAIKHIDLPEEMRRAMARQAEAERERRAKVIAAEGEFQAAQRLGEAASIMAREPITIQLRYLQTLAEIATENNSTTIFPVPMDLLRPLLERPRTTRRREDRRSRLRAAGRPDRAGAGGRRSTGDYSCSTATASCTGASPSCRHGSARATCSC
jgi:hypothetical protein